MSTHAAAATKSSADQSVLEESARAIVSLGLVRMAEFMASDRPDIEVVIKVLNSVVKDIAKVVPEKKADPYAGLRIFNITFENGSMSGSAGPVLEMVEQVSSHLNMIATPAMLANANINHDLDEDDEC